MTTLLQSWLNRSETSQRKANLFAKSYIEIYNRCRIQKKRLASLSVCIKSGPLQNGTSRLYCNTCRFPFRNLRQRWGRFDSLSLMLMPAGKSKPVTWKCTNGCFHSLSLLNFNVLHEGKLHQTFNLEWFQTFVLISGNRVQVPSFFCHVLLIFYILLIQATSSATTAGWRTCVSFPTTWAPPTTSTARNLAWSLMGEALDVTCLWFFML